MQAWLTGWDPQTLQVLALAALALGMLVAGGSLAVSQLRQDRSQQRLSRAVAARAPGQASPARVDADEVARPLALDSAVSAAVTLGKRWGSGRLGGLLLALEERQLLELCGYSNQDRARALYMFARVVLAVALPLLAWLIFRDLRLSGSRLEGAMLVLFLGFGLGWMLPKWVVARRAARRRRAASEELPLLIDLLRLLQGVGLSMDQSLFVVVNDFRLVLPVLASELKIAVDLYARGRTREQSLARLSRSFHNDDLSAICRLIAQVDRHGGAVQDPLLRFAERVREKRRLDLREKVGKLTVKMTGVMVVTLLPALLIVTGGAGFLAVIRGLSRMGGAG